MAISEGKLVERWRAEAAARDALSRKAESDSRAVDMALHEAWAEAYRTCADDLARAIPDQEPAGGAEPVAWQLVPVVMNEAMLAAAHDAYNSSLSPYVQDRIARAYIGALLAAPPAPATNEKDERTLLLIGELKNALDRIIDRDSRMGTAGDGHPALIHGPCSLIAHAALARAAEIKCDFRNGKDGAECVKQLKDHQGTENSERY